MTVTDLGYLLRISDHHHIHHLKHPLLILEHEQSSWPARDSPSDRTFPAKRELITASSGFYFVRSTFIAFLYFDSIIVKNGKMATEDVNMDEPGPSRRAPDANSTSNNGNASGPPAFILPPDPSEAKSKNANFSYITAESRLPPREIEGFPSSKKTGVIYDAQMMLHAPLNYNPDLDWEDSQVEDEPHHLTWHPEDPRRIQRIYDQLQEQGLTKQMLPLPCPTVSVSDVLLVHSEALWHKVEKTQCKRTVLMNGIYIISVPVLTSAFTQSKPARKFSLRRNYMNTTPSTSITTLRDPPVFHVEVSFALQRPSLWERSRMRWLSCGHRDITPSRNVAWVSRFSIMLRSRPESCRKSWESRR
jgi:hypothetical protein